MDILQNIALAPYTTFHIGGSAKFFCEADNLDELKEAVSLAREKGLPILILGGGSNVLVKDAGFPGLVIKWEPKGLEVIDEASDPVLLKFAAGEVWDEVVKLTVERGWWGVENLSHIPGLSGGFAVQNVGAYGQEAQNVTVAVEAFDLVNQQIKTFDNEECQFDYRHSVFNTTQKDQYAIVSITIALSKIPRPNLSYGDVKRYFADKNIDQLTQKQIREVIIAIRNTKFPFPKEAKNGNAGSFFRGPILEPQQIEYLYQKIGTNFGKEALERLHGMTDRLMVPQGMKTPTAFLIDLCGLKGYQVGGAKVHNDQPAIVLNATGDATASDVLSLFTAVGRRVHQQTGVILHMEPDLVGFTEVEKEEILDSVLGDGIITT